MPGGVEVVDERVRDGRETGVGSEFAGVEPVRVAGLGEQLLGFRQVVGHRLGLQREIHHARHDDPGRRAKAEAGHLVDRGAVERVADGTPQPLVVPRRFRVHPVGELDPEDRGVL